MTSRPDFNDILREQGVEAVRASFDRGASKGNGPGNQGSGADTGRNHSRHTDHGADQPPPWQEGDGGRGEQHTRTTRPDSTVMSIDERAAAIAVLAIQLTQDDAARLFAVQVGRHLLFDHTKEEWFEWTGVYWREDDTRLAYEAIRRMMRSLTEPLNRRKGLRATNFAFRC